jgi:hypothetical protein
MVLRFAGEDRRLPLGRGAWKTSRFGLGGGMFPEQPAAASGGWNGDDTYTAKVCFTQTPFVITFTLKLQGAEVQLDSEMNVGFGPTRMPRLTGKAE